MFVFVFMFKLKDIVVIVIYECNVWGNSFLDGVDVV